MTASGVMMRQCGSKTERESETEKNYSNYQQNRSDNAADFSSVGEAAARLGP